MESVATTGVPLSTSHDWREFLETLRSLGTSTLWFVEQLLPPVSELAMRFGRPDSERIYSNASSTRRCGWTAPVEKT